MNPDALGNLLDYHYWARDGVLDAAARLTPEEFRRDLGGSFGSVRDTLAHVLSSEWVWCSRWNGVSPPTHLPAADFETAEDLRRRWHEQEARVRGFVERLGAEGADRVIGYTHFDGEPRRASFRHMLQHVVNHASYHRGQVTTKLRQLGADPSRSQDLIAFRLERG
ncbi:DinB family protein [Candidatus Palauibacter sp.]|uniref:DinB family protein n=1 Tax=Candidatus Palauibacter sp. TaxID=3101350 RepID=UPI003B017840